MMPNSLIAKWKVRLTTGVPPEEPPADDAGQNDEKKNDTEKNEEDKDKKGKAEKDQDEKEDGGKGMCRILLTFFVTFLTGMHSSWIRTTCFSSRPGGGGGVG